MPEAIKPAQAEKSEDARQIRGERTRQALLEAAFDEIHQHGYRAASLNDILRAAGCTKGSLYHHFPDKHALGLAAVVDNVNRFMATTWLTPLSETTDPVTTILQILQRHVDGDIFHDVRLGCPLQNLSQEMSGLDEDFRSYLNGIHNSWRAAIADALRRGQEGGTVRTDVSADAAATMIIATHQGTVGLIKTAQDTAVGASSFEAFYQYLNSLRPADSNTRGHNEGLSS
jgi:TetR/AcrR family transcriptional regulator, transcriptional repressor for nem operon